MSTKGSQPGHGGSPPGRIKKRLATKQPAMGTQVVSSKGEVGALGNPGDEQFPIMRAPLSCHMHREVKEEGQKSGCPSWPCGVILAQCVSENWEWWLQVRQGKESSLQLQLLGRSLRDRRTG